MGTCTSKQKSIVGEASTEKALVRTPTLEGTTPLVKEKVIPRTPPAYVSPVATKHVVVSIPKAKPKKHSGPTYTSQVGGGYYGGGGGYCYSGDGGGYGGHCGSGGGGGDSGGSGGCSGGDGGGGGGGGGGE